MTESAGEVEVVTFHGTEFRRYPDSPDHTARTYFTPHKRERKEGVDRLHREAWKAAHGPIADDVEICVLNHNGDHGDLSNLRCVPKGGWPKVHPETAAGDPERAAAILEANREKVQGWHSSPAGREFHSQEWKRQWAKRKPREVVCTNEKCGRTFQSRAARQPEFCGDACRMAVRRAEKKAAESVVDFVG